MENLKKKYGIGDTYSFAFNASDAAFFSGKPFKKQKKIDIKKFLKFQEKIFALSPDSICTRNNVSVIDSFYSNTNKISYITKNNLQTSNVHFYIKK